MKPHIAKIIWCTTVLLPFVLAAQKAEKQLESFLKEHPSEKLYIHYDRAYYIAGETIWFKAYLYNDRKPSSISENLFLQFCDGKGNVIISERYPVMGAVAKGNLHIPDTLPQGNYYIRALTPQMLNESEDFIYTKKLSVYRSTAPVAATTPPTPALSLQFFPEGGQLLQDQLCVIAFKATDQYGIPAEVDGLIRSDDGVVIAGFHSYHDGIGRLQYKPKAGKKYTAEVETAAGKRTYPLPEAQTAGVQIKIQDEKEGKKFLIARSEKDKANFQNLYLVVQQNEQVVYETDIDFETYLSIEGHLQTDSLPSGILHFTLFNKDNIPLAERLCFIDNGEYRSKAAVNTITINTQRRAANELELQFADMIQRSCSVSIIDLQATTEADRDDIISRFLLTSDLKGYIYNPAWYFENQNDSTRLALDNLLLTHGWTRFNWTKILSGNFEAAKYMDKALINIKGLVVDPQSKQHLAYGKLGFLVEAEDSTSQTIEAIVDATGHFHIDSAAFFGKTKLFYGYTDKNEKQKPALVIPEADLTEKAVQLVSASIASKTLPPGVTLPLNKEELIRRQQQIQIGLDQIKELENVNVRSVSNNKKPEDIVNDKYTTGAFRGAAKETLDNTTNPTKDKSLGAIDFIKNRIQQVEYAGNRFVSRKNFSLSTGQKWLVALYINEQLADAVQLATLRAEDIALVKFFDAGFVGVGSTFPGGAISVYTKEKLPEERRPDKLEYIEYKGYAITKEFYSPDYSINTIRHPASDKRTTLYWSPDIFTDIQTPKVKIRFYNNDFSTGFRVIVEGFDSNGKLVHAEKIVKSD
ncbi:MAG: hypothetical protein NTW29_10035 [Bacteroidetes bacterium]|nr:hypothetical protein [Bacteroidota bacterium]